MVKDTSRKCKKKNNPHSLSILIDPFRIFNERWHIFFCYRSLRFSPRHVQMSLQNMNSSKWQDGTAGPVPDWCQPPLAFLHHPLMSKLLLSSTAHKAPDGDSHSSSLAMADMNKRQGLCEEWVNRGIGFRPRYDRYCTPSPQDKQFDSIALLMHYVVG